MTDPKRLLPAIFLCAFAFALWPQPAAAQRRGRPVRSGGSAVVVVHPAWYGGYYGYGHGYHDPFFWGRERQPQSGFGTLALRVQPRDAVVVVDGEEWTQPKAQGPMVLELGAGSRWMRLDAGAGYRAIGGAHLLHEQLRGVSGGIGLRLGGH